MSDLTIYYVTMIDFFRCIFPCKMTRFLGTASDWPEKSHTLFNKSGKQMHMANQKQTSKSQIVLSMPKGKDLLLFRRFGI